LYNIYNLSDIQSNSIKEKRVISIQETAIFIFCLVGCGIHCWTIGKNSGIVMALEYLEEQGIINLEEEGDE